MGASKAVFVRPSFHNLCTRNPKIIHSFLLLRGLVFIIKFELLAKNKSLIITTSLL